MPDGTGLAVRVVQRMPVPSDPEASMAACAVVENGITSDWSNRPQTMMSVIKSRSLRSQRIGVLEFPFIPIDKGNAPIDKDNTNELWRFAKSEELI